MTGLHPDAADVSAYFAGMGHALTFDATEDPDDPDTGDGRWVLHRPRQGCQVQRFHSIAALWKWWQLESVWILNTDTEFRLLRAWYRQSTPDERHAFEQWADPGSPTDIFTRERRQYDAFLNHASIAVHDLRGNWIDVVRDIELECVVPSERSRSRLHRFIEDEAHAQQRAWLAAILPPADEGLASRRRL